LQRATQTFFGHLFVQVLDTWESLGPGQWTQITLFDTLLEDAMAWNTFLASVVTELIQTWLTKFVMPGLHSFLNGVR
jgi:hypothetical protein